jgi:hypothetical protein
MSVLQFALAALAFFGVDPSIAQQNGREIGRARAAVAEMNLLAVTPDEKALAEHDREIVERAAQLLSNRDRQRTMSLPATAGSSGLGSGQATGAIGAAAGGDDQGQLLAATKQMQETQMSYNLQYLQLQSHQHENRSYSAISNLMKTKHDTVKNSISNIR